MDLKHLISRTLGGVIGGVKAAQEAPENKAAAINSGGSGRSIAGNEIRCVKGNGVVLLPIRQVQFQVAVTTEISKGKKGGIAVFSDAFALGGQGTSDTSDQSVSRIKFSVPVVLTPGPKVLDDG